MKHKSFTLQQKIELYEFKQKNPRESYDGIAKIFGAKWERTIERSSVYKICKRLKLDKEKSSKFATCDLVRRRIHVLL